MLHRCPGCSKISEQDLLTWGNSLIIPFNCPYCDTFYWLEKQVHQDNTETEVTYKITDTQPSWSAQIPEIELGIDVYPVWDSDKGQQGAKPEHNHRLLRLLGRGVVDWPSGVFDSFAAFEEKLEATLGAELGKEDFDRWLSECQEQFAIPKRKHALKNPVVVTCILEKARAAGKQSETLASIIERVISLTPAGIPN